MDPKNKRHYLDWIFEKLHDKQYKAIKIFKRE